MGCDGGTIPRRDELVKIKKKPEKKDKEAELAYRWRHCSIRQLPLIEPVVACGLGRLYTKEAVLEGLLDRTTLPESAQHIRNMKDIKNLNLAPNPSYKGDLAKNGGYIDDGRSPYICPVTGLEMNGKYKFCFLWTCGCVMSERALKEIKSQSQTCHVCQQPFVNNDVVILNAQDEDLTAMEEKFIARKAQKKSKKRANETAKSTAVASTSTSNEDSTSNARDIANKKIKVEGIAAVGVSNKDDALNAGDIANKQVKIEAAGIASTSNGNSGSITKVKKIKSESTIGKSKLRRPEDPAYKKTTQNYSVAQDPKSSEVYKSIFTTHKTAAEQERAHWVTYNPFYN